MTKTTRFARFRPLWGALTATALLGGAPACMIEGNFEPAEIQQEVGGDIEDVDFSGSQWGDSGVLQAAYQEWKRANGYEDENRDLVLALGWSEGLSAAYTEAQGVVVVDRTRGRISVEVNDPEREVGEVWLVDNRPGEGRSVLPEAGDDFVHAGTLRFEEPRVARLEAPLAARVMGDFEVDLVVVTRPGVEPAAGGLLFGTPSLFQRLATRAGEGQRLAATGEAELFSQLVAEGERLFVEETFEGNGRTCGTCHPPQNNFTIDPAFIATLPPDDALFVAEYVPALAENFENPVLMRQFGLILENVDGADDLENKFTMRSVPHTFAQAVSITPSVIDGSTQPPFERTGWSGDGSPGGGTLREFAIGAVNQHAPLTLGRTPGVDFRLPTEAELDAIEAFMLTLGRQQDFDLSAISFHDARAAEGVVVFNGDGKCSGCHSNAGANIGFGANPGTENANFDTGVENAPHPADATGEPRPRDAGFGRDPNPAGGFGDGRFNTTSLIEAADTPPFFHNNLVETIEQAVGFYNSPAFNNSPAGAAVGGIAITEDQVEAVGAFLRVMNTVDNIDRAIGKLEQVGAGQPFRYPSTLCVDIKDSIRVLHDGGLHLGARLKLVIAKGVCGQIVAELLDDSDLGEQLIIAILVDIAIEALQAAQDKMVTFD